MTTTTTTRGTIDRPSTAEEAMQLLYRRHAVRSYAPDLVDDRTIELLLDAAIHAPTAMHREPWRFVVIQDRSYLARLSERAKELGRGIAAHRGNLLKPPGAAGDGIASPLADPEFNIFYDAGTLVVVCGQLTGAPGSPLGGDQIALDEFVAADCWLAAENLMLAASANGLGTCCIGFAVPALNTAETKRELNIPADVHAFAPIIVGVPRGDVRTTARNRPVILEWRR